jgi:hypothetical protein
VKGEYMNKNQFIKLMSLIQNFMSEQETLAALIKKLTSEYPIVIMGDNLINGIIDIIYDALHIEDEDLLGWWLYEDGDKVVYEGEHGEKVISVRTLDELYDYIIMNK